MTLPPLPDPPDHRIHAGCLWYVGLDPAAKQDYFAVVINGWRSPSPVPFLRWAAEFRHETYRDTIAWLGQLFSMYPPARGLVDATRDLMVAQEIQAIMGGDTMECRSMTLQLKFSLKQIGRQVLQNGYRFPNPQLIRDEPFADAVRELMRQLQAQRGQPVANQHAALVKFSHPPGEHDDLAHAWEDSLYAWAGHRKGADMQVSRKAPPPRLPAAPEFDEVEMRHMGGDPLGSEGGTRSVWD